MLNHYGAHTGRFSGSDKLNLQNLPSRGNTTIRRALKAPKVTCSSRVTPRRSKHVLWQGGKGQDLVQAFRDQAGRVLQFASEVYGRKITKADKVERFVGKDLYCRGTLVLSHHGWKPYRVGDDRRFVVGWTGVGMPSRITEQRHQANIESVRRLVDTGSPNLVRDAVVGSAISSSRREDTLYRALDTGRLYRHRLHCWRRRGSVPLWSDATATKRYAS